MNIFGLHPVVVTGTEEQKRRWLPPLIAGEDRACFAVTEPDAGLNTLKLKTRAVRDGDHYVVSGQKIWISTAQVATKVLLLARTTPIEQSKGTRGLSLFYTDLDRRFVEVREIEKMGRKCVDSNQVFFDGLRVPAADLIGEEGRGFEYILHGMNPERILIARRGGRAGPRGAAPGREVRGRAHRVRPADRAEPGRPAPARALLDGARGGEPHGAEGRLALRRGTALRGRGERGEVPRRGGGFRACEQAILTHGGMGYAKEYHVERYMREAWVPRLAPVSPQLILCFIAEKVLGLPKSY